MVIDDMSCLEVVVGFFATFLVGVFLAMSAFFLATFFLVTFFLAAFFVGVFFLMAGVIIFPCQLMVGAPASGKQVEPLSTQALPDFSSSSRGIDTSSGASVTDPDLITFHAQHGDLNFSPAGVSMIMDSPTRRVRIHRVAAVHGWSGQCIRKRYGLTRFRGRAFHLLIPPKP